MDYGYSKELPSTDKRLKRYKKQREKRGFDDTEMWSLDHSLAKHILPRLRRFQETTCSVPYGMTSEEWQGILTKMVEAFEFTGSDDRWCRESKDVLDRVQEGLELFGKYYLYLWQ